MIIWVVKFPKNHWPEKIAFTTYQQASAICAEFELNLQESIDIMYLEENEKRIPFIEEHQKDE